MNSTIKTGKIQGSNRERSALIMAILIAFIMMAIVTIPAGAEDDYSKSIGLNSNSITFYSFVMVIPKLSQKAVVKDILFFNGSNQEIMDARAYVGYKNHEGLAHMFDGNPATQMDRRTASGGKLHVGSPLGKTVTHLIINTPTPSLLSGITFDFRNIKIRSIFKLNLSILKRQPKAAAWRIDLPSLKVTALSMVPADTHYVEPNLSLYFSRAGISLDLVKDRCKDAFDDMTNWRKTNKGLYPHFVGVTCPSAGGASPNPARLACTFCECYEYAGWQGQNDGIQPCAKNGPFLERRRPDLSNTSKSESTTPFSATKRKSLTCGGVHARRRNRNLQACSGYIVLLAQVSGCRYGGCSQPDGANSRFFGQVGKKTTPANSPTPTNSGGLAKVA